MYIYPNLYLNLYLNRKKEMYIKRKQTFSNVQVSEIYNLQLKNIHIQVDPHGLRANRIYK